MSMKNEHTDLNVSYMPFFLEDMSYDGEKPL